MNIIFDVGGVLLNWSVDEFSQSVIQDENLMNRFKEEIFPSAEWKMFDTSVIPDEEVAKRISEKFDVDLELFTLMMVQIKNILYPLKETIEFAKELKNKGHNIYILSNMPKSLAAELESKYRFSEYFHGVVWSGVVHLAKPDETIYNYLLSTYNLDASKTLFIDDTKANIIAAEELGIKSVLFENIDQCKKDLAALGVE